MPPDFSQFGPYLVAALVVFAIYRRFRRSFGRQPVRRGRMTVRIVLLATVATGIAVSLLFLGRVVFRWVQVYTALHGAHGAQPSAVSAADTANGFASPGMVKSPLTVGIFFVLMGYYLCYYGLVLWKSKRLTASDIEEIPAGATP